MAPTKTTFELEIKSISTKEVERAESLEKIVTMAACLKEFPEDITGFTLSINGKSQQDIEDMFGAPIKAGDVLTLSAKVTERQTTVEEHEGEDDTHPDKET